MYRLTLTGITRYVSGNGQANENGRGTRELVSAGAPTVPHPGFPLYEIGPQVPVQIGRALPGTYKG